MNDHGGQRHIFVKNTLTARFWLELIVIYKTSSAAFCTAPANSEFLLRKTCNADKWIFEQMLANPCTGRYA